MQPIYKNIIKTLVSKKDQKKYKVIHKAFEKTNLKEKFDFIFSSPPFFALEIYEKNNIKQSIKQYLNVKEWREKFLFVLIKKCYNYLTNGGYFCIHIDHYIKFPYVDHMVKFIKEKTKFKYVGRIYQLTTYNDKKLINKNLKPRPVFIRIYKK